MTTEQEHWRWIVDWCTETGSLLFLWEGRFGTQPVLMPGFTYYWWLDDSAVSQTHKGDDGTSRLAN